MDWRKLQDLTDEQKNAYYWMDLSYEFLDDQSKAAEYIADESHISIDSAQIYVTEWLGLQ